MGQGHVVTAVVEISFIQYADKTIEASENIIATATDSFGFYGANKVKCNEQLILYDFAKIEPGPTTDTIVVSAHYADREAIERACLPGARPPPDVTMDPHPGEAFIDSSGIKLSRFAVDLRTRELRRAPRASRSR
jgi:hypothetical protein